MIRVLVVDDHAVVRAGLRQFFNDVGDIEIADEAASADAAVRMLRQAEYDVVLLDISMPDKSGVEALKQIKRDHPNVPVLMLSMHPESRYAVQLLRHGASGYLQKEAMPTELVSVPSIHARSGPVPVSGGPCSGGAKGSHATAISSSMPWSPTWCLRGSREVTMCE